MSEKNLFGVSIIIKPRLEPLNISLESFSHPAPGPIYNMSNLLQTDRLDVNGDWERRGCLVSIVGAVTSFLPHLPGNTPVSRNFLTCSPSFWFYLHPRA